jgi:hypothetical protein
MRPICTSNTALRPVRLQPHSCGFNYQCWYSKTNIGAVQFVKPEVSMGLLYGVTGCIILLFLCKSFLATLSEHGHTNTPNTPTVHAQPLSIVLGTAPALAPCMAAM